jgi:hypothetical protein
MFLVACYRVGVQYCECNLVLAIWLKGALQLMGSRIMQLVMGSEIKDLLSTRCGTFLHLKADVSCADAI